VWYRDLAENPADTSLRILDFLAEPFAAACLEPLQARINSSEVPSGFDAHDAATDPAVREEAERLTAELLLHASVDLPADAQAAMALESAFAERVEYFRILDDEYIRSQEIIDQLSRELEERSAWALRLDQEIEADRARTVALQKEFEERCAWALLFDRDIAARNVRIVELVKEVDELNSQILAMKADAAARNGGGEELPRPPGDTERPTQSPGERT
jgi:hypothetical protein